MIARPSSAPALAERAQRLDDDQVAALHVRGAVAVGTLAVAAERLGLVNGIEVADQQHLAAAGAATGRDQMPGAAGLRTLVQPLGREAERGQFPCVDLADAAHAGVVLGRAANVDGFLEQRDCGVAARVDGRDDAPFSAVEGRSRRGLREQDRECGEHCRRSTAHDIGATPNHARCSQRMKTT